MKQFNLSLWLKDKSRKVITRNGMETEIIHDSFPLVAIINGVAYNFDHDGKFQSNKTNHKYDLFFADEEKELTEFEKAIKKLIESCCNEVEEANITNAGAKEISSHILDLARKELLKDLPKWKKATEKKDLEKHIAILEENKVLLSNYLEEGDYYIDLEDLKALPKEE